MSALLPGQRLPSPREFVAMASARAGVMARIGSWVRRTAIRGRGRSGRAVLLHQGRRSLRAVRLDGALHPGVPAYRRDALRAGHRIGGPAVVDQLDSTSLILPGQTAEVDRHGNLIIRLG